MFKGTAEITYVYELNLCSQYCSRVTPSAAVRDISSCYELPANLAERGTRVFYTQKERFK